MEELLRATAALFVVLGLILGLTYMLRRYGRSALGVDGRRSDLRIVEWRGMDSRRKLAVIRWDDREHLVCLGPNGDCHIATRDAPLAEEPSGDTIVSSVSEKPAQPGFMSLLKKEKASS